MLKKALGLIETEGLTAAIEAADAAVKSADVTLVGYELSKGGGLVTVKLTGEVSAIQAAISSAQLAAAKVGAVYSTKVIPRPAPGLEMMVFTAETVGCESPPAGEWRSEALPQAAAPEEKPLATRDGSEADARSQPAAAPEPTMTANAPVKKIGGAGRKNKRGE